jgi:Flagellar hook-length control protein FliK
MIDVKSNQIPLLTKGQTKADLNKEPNGFSGFSLDIGSTSGGPDKPAQLDVVDESTEPKPDALPLVAGGVALVRLKNSPQAQLSENVDPTLAIYGKGPGTKPVRHAALAKVKVPGLPPSDKVPAGPTATARGNFRDATLPIEGAREQPGVVVIAKPAEIGPVLAAHGAIADSLPVAPVVADTDAKSLDPLRHTDQPPKPRGVDAAGARIAVQAPTPAVANEKTALVTPLPGKSGPATIRDSQRNPLERSLAARRATLPGTDAGLAERLKTAAGAKGRRADPGEAKNVEKPLQVDGTKVPSDRRSPPSSAKNTGQIVAPPGATIDRLVPLVATQQAPMAAAPAQRAAIRLSGNIIDLPTVTSIRPAESAVKLVVSEGTTFLPAPSRKPAIIGAKTTIPLTAAVPQKEPPNGQPNPVLAGNEPAATDRKSHRTPKTHSVDARPDKTAAQTVATSRAGPVGQGLVVQPTGQILAEEAPNSTLFDTNVENALGAIEQRAAGHALNVAAVVANAQSPGPVPRAVYQIAQAAAAMNDRPVELSLNPQDLGRVRLTLHSRDGILTVNVAAERPETLLFLRRHIDQLATQLRDVGYQDLSFAFSDQRRQSDENHNRPQEAPLYNNDFAPAWEGDQNPVRINLAEGAGVDIRL